MSGAPFLDAADRLPIEATDLDAAIAEGIVTADQARALTDFAAGRRTRPSPTVDEEDVRFLTSFNDVFVVIGLALSVGSIVGLGRTFAPSFTAPLVAALAWGLSEIFTRRRRMALPSLVLVAVFTAACAGSILFGLGGTIGGAALPILAALAGFAGAFAHWLRFRVPIAMAAMAVGLVASTILSLAAIAPRFTGDHRGAIVLLAGLGVFLFAMRWDVSDRERRTRRSDTAFWLHVLAAPLIVHSLAGLAGATRGFGRVGVGEPGPAIALFVALAVVALVVDRRALLVSGLAYFGGSILMLIQKAGWSGSTVGAVTVGVVGVVVLVLSIAWTPLRDALLPFVPTRVRALVPAPRALRGSPA